MYLLDKNLIAEFEEILQAISDEISSKSQSPNHKIYSNREFCDLMGISSKTAQRWRDQGIIRYSNIGRSIFYRLSDILDMLDRKATDVL